MFKKTKIFPSYRVLLHIIGISGIELPPYLFNNLVDYHGSRGGGGLAYLLPNNCLISVNIQTPRGSSEKLVISYNIDTLWKQWKWWMQLKLVISYSLFKQWRQWKLRISYIIHRHPVEEMEVVEVSHLSYIHIYPVEVVEVVKVVEVRNPIYYTQKPCGSSGRSGGGVSVEVVVVAEVSNLIQVYVYTMWKQWKLVISYIYIYIYIYILYTFIQVT